MEALFNKIRKLYTPVYIMLRVVAFSLLAALVFGAIRFDALYPMEEGYFGEISMTEISQEVILFVLFIFYLFFGYKYRKIQPVANIVSLFFLISFIREFNFLISWWVYPVMLVVVIMIWLAVRDRRKLGMACSAFFVQPASAWFLAGFTVTYIFSRLFGQSCFWLILYDESNYRLAKAAVEEGIELLGYTLMLISAIEFIFVWNIIRRGHDEAGHPDPYRSV